MTSRITSPLIKVVTVVGIAFAVVYGAWSFQDYQSDVSEAETHVMAVARINASLIDAVASFDMEHSRDDHPDGPSGATLSQVSKAFARVGLLAHEGEIVVFKRDGDQIRLLVHVQRTSDGHSRPIGVDSPYGRELVKALSGEVGVFRARNAEGRPHLIAYAPIPSAGWGLFVERDLLSIQGEILERVMVILVLVLAMFAVLFVWIRAQIGPLVSAIEQREQRFRDFADSASEWFWEMGPDFRFVRMFPGRRGAPDAVVSDYLNKRREDLAAEDTTTEKWRRHADDLQNHRPFKDFEFDFKEADGNVSRIRVNGVPFFDDRGAFAGYRGIGTDITEAAKAERLIWEADERARVAFENVTVGCVTIDRSGTIEAFNACAERIFGYRRDEVVGKNVRILMPEPVGVMHDDYLRRYLETGEARIIGVGREAVGRRKSGEEFPIHIGVGEMRVGDTLHFIGSITDLTTEKRLSEQLRRSQKMDAVGQLTGGIAHDFNNILGIIIGNLDLIRRRMDPESPAFRQIGKAAAAAERGARLTRRLLNFARQTPTATGAIDVNEAIRDIEELLSRSLTASIKLQLELSESVWPAKAEASDLDDALTNLILNARDAMPSGGRLVIETSNIVVETGAMEGILGLAAGEYVQISVSDTGTGIPKAVLERIFEPFFSTKDAGKGTGLGLPMVYGFAKRSGGNVSVYSEEGAGTTFRLYLPRSRAEGALPAIDDPAVRHDSLPTGTERVLVVDDEPDLAELAESMLTALGYSVIVVSNAAEALDVLQGDSAIELLLTDIVMPGPMNGIELGEMALSRRPGIKVLLTSGFTGHHFDQSTAERWAGRLLSKPYSNATLARAVRSALDEGAEAC